MINTHTVFNQSRLLRQTELGRRCKWLTPTTPEAKEICKNIGTNVILLAF